jgi:hypothetical protein
MYTLFYSKFCKYSFKFESILKDIKEEKNFRFICIDKLSNGTRPGIVGKYNIKEVPSAIIDGRLYEGKHLFKWLEKKIKNMNYQVSSQNTRVNKTALPQTISGFSTDSSSQLLTGGDEDFSGTSQYCSLVNNQSILTPAEGADVEKSKFILPSDSISGISGDVEKSVNVSRKQRNSDDDVEKMILERSQQDNFMKRDSQRRY